MITVFRKTGVICLLLAVMLMIVGTEPVVLGKSDEAILFF
jgi:hypothetical protein